MKKSPGTEKALLQGAWISATPRQPPAQAKAPEGSIDEGVQSAPVAVESDTRLKKIWVYADGLFTPQSATDSRTVKVRTEAFDLTGYVDLTRALPADQFEFQVRVTMAHASDVLLQRSLLSAGTLVMMHNLAPSNYISGNHIDIIMKQTHSQDNFATKIPIAYQFIVESR